MRKYIGVTLMDMSIRLLNTSLQTAPTKTIQVVGYNSALLLANGYCHTSEGKMIWTLSVTNLYNGRCFMQDVDPTISVS